MKKYKKIAGWVGSRLYFLGMLNLTFLALLGHPLELSVGLVAYPPIIIELQSPFGKRAKKHRNKKNNSRLFFQVGKIYFWRTWQLVFFQSIALAALYSICRINGVLFPAWVISLPFLKWLLIGMSAICPWLGHQPEMRLICWGIEQIQKIILILLIVCSIDQLFCTAAHAGIERVQSLESAVSKISAVANGGAALIAKQTGEKLNIQPIEVVKTEKGYQIRFIGGFHLTVSKDNAFEMRMVIIFLRKLENLKTRQSSRATRDNRRPMLTQAKLSSWFGISQPEISRWEKWWLEKDWANLLSMHSSEVLTRELQNKIVDTMAKFPWWSQKQIYNHMKTQGMNVTFAQLNQAAQESGWNKLKKTLKRFMIISEDCIRPRDEWVVRELMSQIQMLLKKVEKNEALTPEEQLEVTHVQKVCDENNLTAQPEPSGTPLAQKIKWVLFGEETSFGKDDEIYCSYCGSTHVRVKSGQAREKHYQDESGCWKTVDVYRYYCKNPQCKYGSFTHMPLGLLPNSPYPLQMRLNTLSMYEWGRSSYRRTAQAFGLKAGQVYCWVSAFGGELLPIAAMFGVVKSTGVVGIDEKWVQVSDKTTIDSEKSNDCKPRQWMYVYLAIDVYTYDLLHIAIYPKNTALATNTFLLALRAKGYSPRVIVTDLRKEYGPAIKNVFPNTVHHECIFHAIQWMHRQLKDIYGKKYILFCPEAVILKEKIDFIFKAKTKRTAEKRYREVMSLRNFYVKENQKNSCIFDTLERHWPTLVNGIESPIIPRTNNAVERVIGRFDQHYQNFRGFNSIESAKKYLSIFEKVYRFTPFTDDAQPRIRGKCPLELAGYDISNLPMSKVCQGWALNWPINYDKEVVPNM